MNSTVYDEIERLYRTRFPDLTLEVVVLSVAKMAEHGDEDWLPFGSISWLFNETGTLLAGSSSENFRIFGS